MTRRCCKCGKDFGTKEGPNMVTHGFCPKCLEAELRAIRAGDPDTAPLAIAAVENPLKAVEKPAK